MSIPFRGALQAAQRWASHAKALHKRDPRIASVDAILAPLQRPPSTESHSLDLGCGGSPRNPFGASHVWGVEIDANASPTIRRCDLATEPLPFASQSVQYCTAFDVLEHIPRVLYTAEGRRQPFIALMNEIHRVLAPGGYFLHQTPAYPAKEAFQDPTHVNVITEDTIPAYFCGPEPWARTHGYGFTGRFALVRQAWLHDRWLVGLLQAL